MEKTERRLKNIYLDVSVKSKEVEYGNTGMKIGAMMRGYRVVEAEKIIVFVDLFTTSDDDNWWKNKDMLVFVFAHEAAHAIYKADAEVRYNFDNVMDAQYAAETELQKYVEKYHPAWLWDEEMFAYMFASWLTGVDRWGDIAIDPHVLEKVDGIKKWVK